MDICCALFFLPGSGSYTFPTHISENANRKVSRLLLCEVRKAAKHTSNEVSNYLHITMMLSFNIFVANSLHTVGRHASKIIKQEEALVAGYFTATTLL